MIGLTVCNVDVRITHCAICWGFRQRALAIADVLKEKYGATVEITEGALGQFDVYVDGMRVLSRGGSLVARLKPPRLPDTASVLAALEHSRPAANRASVNVDPLQHKFDSADARQFYDRFGARQDLQFYEHAALDNLIAHSDFEQASTVFEIGCGTGRLAKNLLKEHLPENASYVGIDISTTMVEIASKRLSRWNRRASVRVDNATAILPHQDGAFDRVVATYVFDLLSTEVIVNIVRTAHQLLTPNGKLCLVASTEGTGPISRVLCFAWKRLYSFNPSLVGGCRPLQMLAFIDAANWRIEHRQVICSWGICSEIIVASPL